MKFIELLQLANNGWSKTSEIPLMEFLKGGHKNTLGSFIVGRLVITFDPNATDQEQAAEALRVMLNVAKDLDNVIREFAEAA